ncbi:SAM-dependent methyltransferase [Paludifilum halophilum]|uniref:SAM-dependent methyltransferase n=2 Tax=Paludifilum halophilum TaxID=1642702 RepID=A0A235B460_9BACL|nr:SAM-dependent methyltransferase [Paludifilum halophilum]
MYRWADYYDWTSDGLDGDRSYYSDLAMNAGGPVLELGCGTGRCTLAIARHGVPVVGVDRQPEMLQKAKEKAEATELDGFCRWVEADMSQLHLNERFNLIIIPYRSFLHLLTVREQIAALRGIHRHLEKDGMFAMNILVPHPHQLVEEEDSYLYRGSYAVPGFGETVEVYDAIRFDHYHQQGVVSRYYERFDRTGRSIERLKTGFSFRYIYPVELDHLLQLAGFEVVHRYGGFRREPFGPHSSELIIEARKKKGTEPAEKGGLG